MLTTHSRQIGGSDTARYDDTGPGFAPGPMIAREAEAARALDIERAGEVLPALRLDAAHSASFRLSPHRRFSFAPSVPFAVLPNGKLLLAAAFDCGFSGCPSAIFRWAIVVGPLDDGAGATAAALHDDRFS